jgi:microsomal dipeptidase-like Zn-dependent dipeptidase
MRTHCSEVVMERLTRGLAPLVVALVVGCGDPGGFGGGDTDPAVGGGPDTSPTDTQSDGGDTGPARPPGPDYEDIYAFANGCYTMDAAAPGSAEASFLAPTDDGDRFAFRADDADQAARLFLKPSDLGTYILYDQEERYVVGTADGFEREAEVSSDIFELDDSFKPGVQWEFERSVHDDTRFQLRHLETGKYLTTDGLTDEADEAAVVTFHQADGCTAYPELGVDATGEVRSEPWDDGSVWGFAETHTHIMSNFGFGGAGMFHGAAFHPLGVEHALPSCEMFHGAQGRKDLFGYGFDRSSNPDQQDLLTAIAEGQTPKPNHVTAGYPEFTDWPDAPDSSTHQTQYYKWIERAYLGGMRLMVQHATSNQVICQLLEGSDTQPTRYSCNDMVAVDRSIEETRKMERYIDAQEGGPGEGWFRIVESPQQAREVINDGKMAVVLGIEVSNLFDCFLVPPEGKERCDRQDVVERLDEYHDRGVRAIFPVHKYDNGFSAGDGHRGIIELGNFGQTGHESNFTTDCPDVPAVFDQGDVQFGDLNNPRDDYFAPPPYDISSFSEAPVDTLFEHADMLTGGSLEGDYCQNHGLTDLGEFLIEELMARGMIVEVDHLPQRSYKRAFEILEAHDYPAAGTHGSHYNGKIYELGGVSKFNFGTCADPNDPGSRADPLNRRIELREQAGAYPAEGFGFDLNGFAGAPDPRFGEESPCEHPQENPVEYPFDSYAGGVTFTEPGLGNRTVDFNTEGFVHIGMIPELIQDVRNTGVTDEELEPLFRSAEGYLRMWEKAELRAEDL